MDKLKKMEEKKSIPKKPSFGLRVVAILFFILGLQLLIIGLVSVFYLLHSKGKVLNQNKVQPSHFLPPSEQKVASEEEKEHRNDQEQKKEQPLENSPQQTTMHTVKEGETLQSLARRYRVSIFEIKKYNPNLGASLVPGQKLLVPVIEKEQEDVSALLKEAEGKRIYTVRQGDSLWKIARRFHLSVKEIVDANQIKDPTKLKIGQELIIPYPKVNQEKQTLPPPNPHPSENSTQQN
ncbi:LysM peptidoglycan-binding domain-containing protein [Candidatus Methylacidiphilum infernorum]|uniref:LysM peptidoglycan-binding domain-containing protein n=1 Tax=Candidatus Methylacidiphilum infernorum TaxID=511746 RepID=A0ABX7PWD8_9BACT|nr:LysM domain-containing protein [Candidatus Methylacidiphilum infernorum]QSR87043.1 LysM peptidoglycan-binding domain-containing protein [Candidatus Methylacidiphilum infernorum]